MMNQMQKKKPNPRKLTEGKHWKCLTIYSISFFLCCVPFMHVEPKSGTDCV